MVTDHWTRKGKLMKVCSYCKKGEDYCRCENDLIHAKESRRLLGIGYTINKYNEVHKDGKLVCSHERLMEMEEKLDNRISQLTERKCLE